MNSILAIVVTYNRKELLRECIEALLASDKKDFDILIVDNASTDGTREYIEYLLSEKIIYKNTGANIGGAGGFSFGLKVAGELKYDYAWLMDDDTIVHRDSLSKLWKIATKYKDKYSFLSSQVNWTDGSECVMNKVKPLKINVEALNKMHLEPIRKATFVSFFVPMTMVVKYGLPIKEFFIWSDDMEFSSRISKNKVGLLVKDSVVTHKSKTNSRPRIAEDDAERIDRYLYAYRNELYIAKRDGVWKILKYCLRMMLETLSIFIHNSNYKTKKIIVILNGVWQGIWFNPKIENI